MGLVQLLTRNHGELARLVFPTAVATGFVWTLASGRPLVDPYRWLSGDETAADGPITTTMISLPSSQTRR